jgi:hypothetical protein
MPNKDGMQVAFRKMPGDSCILRGKYLEFGTQGSGAFGWINQGVDTKTGDSIAIKEIRINNYHTRVDVMDEVNMGKRFLVSSIQPEADGHLIHHRTKEASFLSWKLGVSMAILIVAAIWRSFICLCLTGAQISIQSFGQVRKFLTRPN